MDLNIGYMIPYLANNPYIYGERYEPTLVNPSKTSTDETLIRSIKNPIPCYRDERLNIYQDHSGRQVLGQDSSYNMEKSPKLVESLQVPESGSYLPSPVPRPLNFPENSNLAVQGYDTRQRFETSQSRCYSATKAEPVYLEVPASNERRPESFRRDLSTPSNQQYRDLKETRGYSGQKEKTYEYSTRNIEDDKSSNYSRSEASQDPRYIREGSYCSRRPETGSYYIDKYAKENTNESYPIKYKEPLPGYYQIPEPSVLSESNSITPARSKNQISTCTQSVRSGAFLDDIIDKYKDRLLEKDARSENTNFNREIVSRTSDYSYKEDLRTRHPGENSTAKIRPTREIWMQQARNANDFNGTRPTLECDRLNKSSQNLIAKNKTKTGKSKKKTTGRSTSSNKEKWTCERRAFEDMVVKVLKSHAKHCPALRKEIDSMKFTRIFNI